MVTLWLYLWFFSAYRERVSVGLRCTAVGVAGRAAVRTAAAAVGGGGRGAGGGGRDVTATAAGAAGSAAATSSCGAAGFRTSARVL